MRFLAVVRPRWVASHDTDCHDPCRAALSSRERPSRARVEVRIGCRQTWLYWVQDHCGRKRPCRRETPLYWAHGIETTTTRRFLLCCLSFLSVSWCSFFVLA